MKKNLLNIIAISATTLLAVLSQSCTSTADEGNMGSFPYLEIEEPRVEITKSKQTVKVAINTNRNVIATEKHDWITTSVSDQKSITINVSENTEEKSRQGQITVTTYDKLFSETITVIQDESGVHTYKGDITISTDTKLAEFVKNYTRVEGNLILGSEVAKNPSSLSEAEAEPKAGSLTDISSLSTITEVTGYITVGNNPNLKDLSVLKSIASFSEIRISNNPKVTSISFLKDMKDITTLILTHSDDFSKYESTVSGLTQLTYLDISCNGITDISFLKRLTNLQTLILGTASGETNYISDITVLNDLKSLRNLNVSGLPLTIQEIDEFKDKNPSCNVTMDQLAASTPVLSKPGTSSKNQTSLTLTCTVVEQGTDAITKSGFYFGEDPDNMTKILANVKNGYITHTKTGLSSSKKYYFYAWAENLSGMTVTETVSTYTSGIPQVDSLMTITPSDNSITVNSKLFFNGGSTAECGTIIGQKPDITIEDNLYKKSQNTDQETDYTWTSTFTNLNAGYRYYVRSYAKNEYGTVYNTAKKVYTTGTPDVAISVPTASEKSDHSLNLRSVINNMEYGTIAEAGFYISLTEDNIEDAQMIIATVNTETGEITASADNLQSSTKYYIRSFVEFEVGVAVRSDVAGIYTYGIPVIDTEKIDYTSYDNSIEITGRLAYTGGEILTYGAVISKTDDLDIDNYLNIITYTSATELEDQAWFGSFSELNSGYRYFIRHYATNSYGTAYSDPIEVYTTGETWIPSYKVYMAMDYPAYANYEETSSFTPVGLYYREDIAATTNWFSLSESWDNWSSDSYYYCYLMEGVQNIMVSNVPQPAGNIWDQDNPNILSQINPDEQTLIRYSISNAGIWGGLGSEIIVGTVKDCDIKEFDYSVSPINVELKRLTARLNLSMTYSDKFGKKVNDLSQIISSYNVRVEGFYNECNIGKDMSVSYGKADGYIQLDNIYSISTSDTQDISNGLHLFPTPNGNNLKFTVDLTFIDGKKITLYAGTKGIVANNCYDLVINVSEVEGEVEGNFNVEVMENVKEEIEF